MINNACATQALLSILLNINDPNIQLGDTLTSFKTFTQTFDPVVSIKPIVIDCDGDYVNYDDDNGDYYGDEEELVLK